MRTTVVFRHLEPTKALKDYVEDKIEKVQRYFSKPLNVHVVLSTEKFNHICEVTVTSKDLNIKTQEINEDMYASIDKVTDKIERRLKKQKEIRKDHKSSVDFASASQIFNPDDDGSIINFRNSKGDTNIIKIEQYSATPLSFEDAIKRMEYYDGNFIIFSEIASDEINIIYKKQDKTLELVTLDEKSISDDIKKLCAKYKVKILVEKIMPVSSPIECTEKMTEKGEDFFVFKNKSSDKLSVIYKKKSRGNYGLIET